MTSEQCLGLVDAVVEVPEQDADDLGLVEVVGDGGVADLLDEGLQGRVEGADGLVPQSEHVGVEHRRVVVGLLRPGHDPAGRVDGVTLASGETLPARLVIAADGRRSVLRDAARLPLDDLGAPMDVLWFRVPMPADLDMTEVPLGTIDKGGMVVAIPRGDYWQCAQIIEKGGFAAVKARGIAAFRETIVAIAPGLAAGIDAIGSFDDVKLLSVALDRLTRWWQPGLLAIGDAAHAMSPVGGVGINLAVQDAVAAANILAAPLAAGADPDPLLAQVQDRRWKPTTRMQALQRFAHQRVVEPMLRGEIDHVPLAIRLLDHIPLLRRIPGRMLGLGFGRQHVQSPLAKDFS